MRRDTVRLWTRQQYPYPSAWGFIPKLDGYLHDDDMPRPAIIIAPGGGYRRCAPREGECVARRFFEMGYQAFVCTYTTNPLGIHPLFSQPAKDIAQAVRYVRRNAAALRIMPDRIILCGFSAGAHAAGTAGVHWMDFAAPDDETVSACRPDAILLCYPVVSICSEISHGTSSRNLLGEHPTEEMIRYMQLEKNVGPDCPPAFLWHAVTDRTVSAENSRVFADACRKAGVPCELHLFSSGNHGLSLADGSITINDANMYTFEQTACVLDALERGMLKLSPEMEQQYLAYPEVRLLRSHGKSAGTAPANEEVSNWVVLAQHWLCRLWDR